MMYLAVNMDTVVESEGRSGAREWALITYSSAWVRKLSDLTRDGTAETVSRDQILRRERGQGKCSADQKQEWHATHHTVDAQSAERDK